MSSEPNPDNLIETFKDAVEGLLRQCRPANLALRAVMVGRDGGPGCLIRGHLTMGAETGMPTALLSLQRSVILRIGEWALSIGKPLNFRRISQGSAN